MIPVYPPKFYMKAGFSSLSIVPCNLIRLGFLILPVEDLKILTLQGSVLCSAIKDGGKSTAMGAKEKPSRKRRNGFISHLTFYQLLSSGLPSLVAYNTA
jgi:hypothetical protein